MQTEALYQALPYGREIRLLEKIDDWSSTAITCSSCYWQTSALLLSSADVGVEATVSPLSFIEFAAQALALHGVLASEESAGKSTVRLVAVKGLQAVDHIDINATPLMVSAILKAQLSGSGLYGVRVSLGSEHVLEAELLVASAASV